MLLYLQNEYGLPSRKMFNRLFLTGLLLISPFLMRAQVQPPIDTVKLLKDGTDVLRRDSIDFENKFIESELEKVQFERYSESLKREALRKLLENQRLQNASLQQKLLNEQLKSESVRKSIESEKEIAFANEEREKQQKRIKQLEIDQLGQQLASQKKSRNYLLIGLSGLAIFGIFLLVTNRKLYKRSKRIQELSTANLQKELEKQEILSSQNEKLELQVKERTSELQTTINHLKDTQSQLIRAEKMASLGELTAGIAHEIQNPLNFVNNFTDVSLELIQEMLYEVEKGDLSEAKSIAGDISDNLERIHHHGDRAAAIIRGMLMHSRSETGAKEFTDLNMLCREFTNLAMNGLKLKDQEVSFIRVSYDLSEEVGQLKIAPQDLGKVIVGLVNNAVYAVLEKRKQLQLVSTDHFTPAVHIATRKDKGRVRITVTDNGNGVPEKIVDRIFQPFFTTKPTGQGTGLGLSLSYDIITKGHGGELDVQSKIGEGATFTISLPL